jgi:hypothetical protein
MRTKIKYKHLKFVIPAKAGIQGSKWILKYGFTDWIPAFAGMTD